MTGEVRQALKDHKQALLRTLKERATPCSHARAYRRPDGTFVCGTCVMVKRPGASTWEAQTLPQCVEHAPYPSRPEDGPLRQCRNCPHVWRDDTPLFFPSDQQPQRTGALMLVFAPGGGQLSSGPVKVLGIRGAGQDRELQWYNINEDRQRWHTAELCQEYTQKDITP